MSVPAASDLPLAPLSRRLAALLYEALVVVAIVLVASFAIAPLVSPRTAAAGQLAVPSIAGRLVSLVALFALGAAYFGYCWSDGRRTLPMKTWQLALVTREGAPLARRQALARYAAAWIAPALALAAYALLRPHGLGALAWPIVALNWLAAFVDSERQFLHDRIAGTRVVSA